MQFPSGERLGRVSVYPDWFYTEIKSKPTPNSSTVRKINDDDVIEWVREVIGTLMLFQSTRLLRKARAKPGWKRPRDTSMARICRRSEICPIHPMAGMPEGKAGFWAEVTVPYVDLYIDNPPFRTPSFRYINETGGVPRLYYSQVVWIDQTRTDETGRILYRWNEDFGRGYGYGDVFWADGAAFRMITEEEVAPISPDVDPAKKRSWQMCSTRHSLAMRAIRKSIIAKCPAGMENFPHRSAHWPPGGR
jgi:hypothetical protein